MDQHPSPIARLSLELGDSGTNEILPPTERNLTMLSEGKLEELADRFTRSAAWRRKHKVGANGGYVTADDFDEVLALISELRALRAERDAQKRRADNHWETLRSIRDIAKLGDCERIIQWVNDAGGGYTEAAEETLAKAIDRAQAAEAELAALRAQAPAPVGGEVVEAARAVSALVWSGEHRVNLEGSEAVQTFVRLRKALAALSPDPTEGGTDE